MHVAAPLIFKPFPFASSIPQSISSTTAAILFALPFFEERVREQELGVAVRKSASSATSRLEDCALSALVVKEDRRVIGSGLISPACDPASALNWTPLKRDVRSC